MAAKIYLTTFSVRKIDIDWNNQGNYRVLGKVMAPRVEVNTSNIIPKIEQSSANTLQRIVLQLQFIILNTMNGSQA